MTQVNTEHKVYFLQHLERSYRMLLNYGARQIKELDITLAQLMLLGHLAYLPDASQETLSKSLYLAKSAISLTVRQLIDKGYLERIPDSNDKRTSHLIMSTKGRELLPRIYELVEDIETRALSTLTEYEKIVFLGLLEKVETQILDDLCDKKDA